MAERPERQASDASGRGSAWLPKAMPSSIRNAGPVVGAAYSLIGAIVLLGVLGYFADQWLGTDPWLLIAGLLLGIVVGFYELAKVVWRRTP
jgi:F0F1-type ATP synthase assembly protein I